MTVSASELGAVPMSLKVRVASLDLSTPNGVAELYARIRNAARTVCGYADNHFYQARAGWNECVDRTIDHAVASVGNAKLTAYSLAKAGRRAFPITKTSSVVDRLP
jgi:UrcA family protein